jgi:hypothetical protein
VNFLVMAERPLFWDRQGEPLDTLEYGALCKFHSYKRVDESRIGDLWISTVWIGMDMAFWTEDPVIFETMVFSEVDPDSMHPELAAYVEAYMRYRTEEEALRGHAAVCMDVRQTIAKIEMAEAIHNDAIEHPLGHPCRACGETFHNHPNKECNGWY